MINVESCGEYGKIPLLWRERERNQFEYVFRGWLASHKSEIPLEYPRSGFLFIRNYPLVVAAINLIKMMEVMKGEALN